MELGKSNYIISEGNPLILIAGGYPKDVMDHVELFDIESKTSCPASVGLDQKRYDHSGTGEIVCSGKDEGHRWSSSCYNLTSQNAIYLKSWRPGHCAWSTPEGIYLMGGEPNNNLNTTELVKFDGTTESAFNLEYRYQ